MMVFSARKRTCCHSAKALPKAWSRNKDVPNRVLAIFLAVAIAVGLVLPAPADERPSDPFGNHTTELNRDAPLVVIWDALRDRMQIEKAYFHECLESKEPPCPSIPPLVQKLDEIRHHRGKALLGHLNISVNLMIKPAPSVWTGPLEAITMRNGDCKLILSLSMRALKNLESRRTA
jgi:hypothetical protein